MPRMLKSLRLAAVAGALALGAGAAPSQAATIAPETPDCYTTCTRTLGPGQRLVVGNPFAFNSVTVNGTADGFGAHFVIKQSPTGTTYTKVREVPLANSIAQTFTRTWNPTLVPGSFRAIAINDSTWLTTKVTLSVNVSAY